MPPSQDTLCPPPRIHADYDQLRNRVRWPVGSWPTSRSPTADPISKELNDWESWPADDQLKPAIWANQQLMTKDQLTIFWNQFIWDKSVVLIKTGRHVTNRGGRGQYCSIMMSFVLQACHHQPLWWYSSLRTKTIMVRLMFMVILALASSRDLHRNDEQVFILHLSYSIHSVDLSYFDPRNSVDLRNCWWNCVYGFQLFKSRLDSVVLRTLK